MKPYQANLLAGVVCIAMSLWGYFDSSSATAFIPAGFGLIFLILTPLFRKENKVVAHIIVLLTLLLIVALFRPLFSRINANDTLGIIRVGLMVLICLYAFIIYIQSFIAARKARS